jgi:RNA recognition motif-containing protein
MNIFVACLNPVTTSRDLQKLFAHYGLVTSVKVIMDHFTGRSKRYGFVEMPNNYEAGEALLELDNTSFMEYVITVKNSQPAGFRISADETATRNSSVPAPMIGALNKYCNSNTTDIIIQRRDSTSPKYSGYPGKDLRHSGYRGNDYRSFDQY